MKRLKNELHPLTHDNIQVIHRSGKPEVCGGSVQRVSTLIKKSYDNNTALIPREVVELVIEKKFNLLKAWCKYLGLTQKTVFKKAGITQSALFYMERLETNHRTATLERLAKAMGIVTARLVD